MTSEIKGKVLVTGATGYIGSNLVGRLLENGYGVRVMSRHSSGLERYEWLGRVEVVEADVLRPETLGAAVEGVQSAYYLIHSMAGGKDFEERDRQAARNFASAASSAGVGRIIYLGGLGRADAELSPHLRSRQDVGRILGETGVPVTEFRAAVIIGSGSLSFEMIRYLTERLPAMICPKWAFNKVQPISLMDVLSYLEGALEHEGTIGRVIEIGGCDILRYADLMKIYARLRGLRRVIIRVPVLTPGLSSRWVHLITPVPTEIAAPLIEGLRSEVIVHDRSAEGLFPEIEPEGYESAVRRALGQLHPRGIRKPPSQKPVKEKALRCCAHAEGMIVYEQSREFGVEPGAVFDVLRRMGGEYGWWGMDRTWRVRGFVDRMFGGEGFVRQRSRAEGLAAGDRIDFLDVEYVEQVSELLVRVRYRFPGLAWLRFEVQGAEKGGGRLVCTTYFAPKGLGGLFYWYSTLWAHRRVFERMLGRIVGEAEKR